MDQDLADLKRVGKVLFGNGPMPSGRFDLSVLKKEKCQNGVGPVTQR